MRVFSDPLHWSWRTLRRQAAVAACCLCMQAVQAVYASDQGDHDRARRAVQAGLVLPLPMVLDRLQREVPGQVLEVELDEKRGVWVYEIKLLTPAGQLTKVHLDAQTAQVLRIQPRGDKAERRDGRGHH